MRVLIIEDEQTLQLQLCEYFQSQGFLSDGVDNGKAAIYQAKDYHYDVIICDWGLPDISGIEVIRTLRSQGITTPLLMLTAKDRWQDKVQGLEVGADDYLAKPFQFEELLARIQALVRRSLGVKNQQLNNQLQQGNIQLDFKTNKVSVNHKSIDLTTFEYRILEALMMRPGEVLSKMSLVELLYQQDFDRDSNVIEVLVARLRRKLDPNNRLQPIETLRGRGYRLKV